MYKVLIADDERIAREIIHSLLISQSDIDTIYQAKDGNQALTIAQQYQPDIVFLDIQMPGMTGIQLAEKLSPECVVIFVTAYDKYAVDAFEMCAIDYLLKPFDDERFLTSLTRARKYLEEQKQTDYSNLQSLIRHVVNEEQPTYKTRLIVREPKRIRLIDIEQINYIQGAGNYAEVHLFGGQMILHRETLTSLEEQLDPQQFIRIHRSTIIRESSVSELRPTEKGDYQVLLKCGTELTLSRRNKVKLAQLLG